MAWPMLPCTTPPPKISRGNNVHNGAAQLVSDKRAFDQKTFDDNATMYQMAIDTGGHAYVNTNDIAKSIDSALSHGANYYTIAYTPTDPNWNGNFRTIQVKLAQQGYTLAYRRGYFADDPDTLPKNSTAPGSTAPAASDAMRLALLRGGPSRQPDRLPGPRPSRQHCHRRHCSPQQQPRQNPPGPLPPLQHRHLRRPARHGLRRHP